MKTGSHRKTDKSRLAVTRRTFTAGVGAAGLLAASAPFQIGRAPGAALKVGVLLPRSGVQAGIGQACQRGVDIFSVHHCQLDVAVGDNRCAGASVLQNTTSR